MESGIIKCQETKAEGTEEVHFDIGSSRGLWKIKQKKSPNGWFFLIDTLMNHLKRDPFYKIL